MEVNEVVQKLLDYRFHYEEMQRLAKTLKGKQFLVKGKEIGLNTTEEMITIDEVDISENWVSFTYTDIAEDCEEDYEEDVWDGCTLSQFVYSIIN